jgi:hypothetical protein
VVSACWCSSALWGRCLVVIECDISQKVDWTYLVDCMASAVAVSKSSGYFSCGDT